MLIIPAYAAFVLKSYLTRLKPITDPALSLRLSTASTGAAESLSHTERDWQEELGGKRKQHSCL
jgi:hypothetical protein